MGYLIFVDISKDQFEKEKIFTVGLWVCGLGGRGEGWVGGRGGRGGSKLPIIL